LEAPIEQVSRELQASGGPAVLKYNVGGRGAPRVPRPPGFDHPYIPSVWLVTADGTQVRYEGDRDDVQRLATFALGDLRASDGPPEVHEGCAEEDEAEEPEFVSDLAEIDNITYSEQKAPHLIVFWAPWCGWSRRFVTDGGLEAPIEQVSRELQASGGPAVLKYNVGGRGAPRVPRPPGFDHPYIPSVWLVTADGTQVRYEGDRADIQGLVAFALGDLRASDGVAPAAHQGCAEDDEAEEPEFVSDIAEIDNITYSQQEAPFLITFWAPWCGWSRRFVTDGGSEAPIERVHRGLGAGGATVLKYNVGGRGAPRVPLPEGFSIRGIPTVILVSADGSQVTYEGDPAEVDALIAFVATAR